MSNPKGPVFDRVAGMARRTGRIELVGGWLRLATETDISDAGLIENLMAWRAAADGAFVSQFQPTRDGTVAWLRGITRPESGRVLFLVMNPEGAAIGHVGLCRCAWNDGAVAVENVLRGAPGAPRFVDVLSGLADWVWRLCPGVPLELDVFADMQPAVALYRRLGFRQIGARPLWARRDPGRILWTEEPVRGSPVRDMSRLRLDAI